jgi:alkanesulfonate monooxygenase SsuD/methylene tetrahydromethanopterin reductase-like flavin-dependent oxidoreductase (luciferase family)
LLIGGRSDAVFKRVARHAAMWQTTTATLDEFPNFVAKIRAEPGGDSVEVGRVIAYTDSPEDMREAVKQWERAGAQHLSINFGPPEGRIERMRRFASEFQLAT